MAQALLTGFYKQTKNTKENNTNCVAKPAESSDFYDECIRNLSKCTEESCKEIKANLNDRIISLRQKCEKTTSSIECAKSVLTEKDKEIEILQKKLESTSSITDLTNASPAESLEESLVESSTSSSSKQEPTNATKKIIVSSSLQSEESISKSRENETYREQPSFNNFSNNFVDNHLAHLRSIGPTQRDDSTFVSFSLRFIYNENMDCIKGKTLTGRGKNKNEPKKMLTPDKVVVLKNIFNERLNMVTVNADERNARNKLFNKHVSNAIGNVNRGAEKTEINDSIIRKLEESMNKVQ